MVHFNSSTWLVIVVFVNVVSAANIEETEDNVKIHFMSLLKNIVNINEKRIDAMKHIEDEKDFRLGSYLSKIHNLNDDGSLEYETDQKNSFRILDMRRNLNLAFMETYPQQGPVIKYDAEIFLPSKRLAFQTLKNNNKETVLNKYDTIFKLPGRYQSEPGILDIRNKSENISNIIIRKDNDIIVLSKQYLGKSSIDNLKTKLIKSDDNSEKKKNTIFQNDNNTLKLLKKYRRKPIQDLMINYIKLNDSYQKKRNEVHKKEHLIRKLQDIIKVLKKQDTIKDQTRSIQRKIVNHYCHDVTEQDTKCEEDKKTTPCIINCCNFADKIDVKHQEGDARGQKQDNIPFVFTFDDGKEDEESQRTDWSYEFAKGSRENKGDRQNAKKYRRGSDGCGKTAAKSCQSACSLVHEKTCTRHKCVRQARQAFRKECKRTCAAAFLGKDDSEDRL